MVPQEVTISSLAVVGLSACIVYLMFHRKQSRASSAGIKEKMRQTYSFRIRFNRSPTDTIECMDNELQLPLTSGGTLVVLRNTKRGKSIKEAEHLALCGEGYATEVEAQAAGDRLQWALMVALARVRVGADFGERAAKGAFTIEGLNWLEQQHGQRMLNNVHGFMTYASEPPPRFALTNSNMVRGVTTESFTSALQSSTAIQITLTERERLAFTLFNASFFQHNVDSRFLLLVMAIEALIEPAPRSADAQQHVDELISMTKSSSLEPAEKNSMIGSLRWLAKESISQAGKRLVSSRLGERVYSDLSAPAFLSRVYQMRSDLVHGNLPYPSFDRVGEFAGNLEVFVADLLTAPFFGQQA